MQDLLRVGVITKAHGVRGEVKVYPTTDDPARFKKLKTVILDDGKEQIELNIASVKFFKNMVILKFKEYDNINDIEKYRNAELFVTREHAVKLKPGEYFRCDLIGLNGISDEEEELGILEEIIETGANDVYVFRKKGTSDLLVPAIPSCIKEVDLEGKMITIHLLPGLREV